MTSFIFSSQIVYLGFYIEVGVFVCLNFMTINLSLYFFSPLFSLFFSLPPLLPLNGTGFFLFHLNPYDMHSPNFWYQRLVFIIILRTLRIIFCHVPLICYNTLCILFLPRVFTFALWTLCNSLLIIHDPA